MNFQESLKILGIEDYAERIWKSSSTGELFHLQQYILIAEEIKQDPTWFRAYFEAIVEMAELYWKRPESVFQHMHEMLVKQAIKESNH